VKTWLKVLDPIIDNDQRHFIKNCLNSTINTTSQRFIYLLIRTPLAFVAFNKFLLLYSGFYCLIQISQLFLEVLKIQGYSSGTFFCMARFSAQHAGHCIADVI